MKLAMRLLGCFIMGLTQTSLALNAETRPVSIVDYLKEVKIDSSFDNRKKLFDHGWPSEKYAGTAAQNTKLLEKLLRDNGQVMMPLASGDIAKCKEFYGNAQISKHLTAVFVKNAIAACVVTGTSVHATAIRKELQRLYSETKPADGKTFSALEHKKIHDQAYKAAGCKEDSAAIGGWMVVNEVELPESVVKWSIEVFGECTTVKAE